MSAPRTIPSTGAKDVVTFTIKVDGQALPRRVEVSAITTFKAIGRISFARLEILDGDPARETFTESDSDHFVPGREVEIKAGYRSEEDLIFKGIIVAQKIRIRPDGRGLLTVVCRHALYQATLARRSRTYQEMSDSEAISEALQDYGLTLESSSSPVQHESLVQYQSSDWDFALARAEANGLFLIPTDEGASLAEPGLSSSPVLQLSYGSTILELDLEMDSRTQPTELTAISWSPADQEVLEATAAEPSLPAAGNLDAEALSSTHGQAAHLQHPAHLTQEELEAFASAELLTRRLARITGRVRCTGTPVPLPGTLVELQGLGQRFNGKYLVSAVRHQLYRGQWLCDIQVGLPDARHPHLDSPAPHPASSLVPPIHGLHLGVVEELEGDPEGEFRVLVRLAALGEETEAIWARLGTLDAGSERGSCFHPEVGDEVVVSFLSDDPRHAVILGSLHSSAHPAPIEPNNDNHEKGYVSRGEMKLLFNDDLKSVFLETPNGNKVELSEDQGGISLEDENGNRIVMNSDGILLESAADLILNASGDITLGAINITAEAEAQFTGTGSAGAEISASGSTVIKGSIVQIN